jgi:hypothetical protein
VKKFKDKLCKMCGDVFTPSSPAALYCIECSVKATATIKDKQRVKAKLNYREKQLKLGRVVAHGKGSANICGKDNPMYRNGIGRFHKVLKYEVKDELRYCQDCGKDLLEVSQYHWCCHHIDHDRNNNVRENLTLLCKSCHQKEHLCWNAFQGKENNP